MNPFRLRCGVDVSIQNSVNLQAKYNKMDTYLSVLRKNWLQIKADVHYLPHAVFTGMEKKNLSPNYLSYKQIFRETIKEIKMADKYIDFIADTVDYVNFVVPLFSVVYFLRSIVKNP